MAHPEQPKWPLPGQLPVALTGGGSDALVWAVP